LKKYIADDISIKVLKTNEAAYSMKDLWAKKNLGSAKRNVTAEIPSHDVVMIRLVQQ
jgi:alpha-galactosidase